MRILITGISGFAGSHLAESLLRDGEEIFGLVRHKGNCPNLKFHSAAGPGILNLIEGDLCQSEIFSKIIREVKPDEIYHLAAVTHVPQSLEDPVLAFEVNFAATRNLFDAVLQSGQTSKILFAGSADAYGDISPDHLPANEDCPFRPLSPYALSKAAADLLAFQYYKNYGLPVLRARPFNHIGPKQSTSFAISSFAQQIAFIEAKKKEPVLDTGNLNAEKDFLDVRDVVEAYRLVLKKGDPGEAYNICRGKAYSIRFLLEKMIEISGRKIEIRQDQERTRKVEVLRIFGDNSALKSKTGWQPVIPIEKSLEEILSYHRRRL